MGKFILKYSAILSCKDIIAIVTALSGERHSSLAFPSKLVASVLNPEPPS